MSIFRTERVQGRITPNLIKKVGGFLKMTNQFVGGTTYTNGSETWRVFTATGPITTSALMPTSLVMNPKSASIGSSLPGAVCDILVVAGGGGAGQGTYSGGGAGGGFVYHEDLVVPAASHTITVGSGGGARGSGTHSSAFPGTPADIIAVGGGYGVHDTEHRPGGPGGSGGGASFRPNNFKPNNNAGSAVQPNQPGISGTSGRGNSGNPAPRPGGDHGTAGGGAGGSGGESYGVPESFLPAGGGNWPSTFLGAPSSNATAYRHFSGGGGGQTEGPQSNVPSGYPGRGSGGPSQGSSGAGGVVIIKVK